MALLDSEGFGFSTNASDYLTYGLMASPPNAIGTAGPLGDNYAQCGSYNGGHPISAGMRYLPGNYTTFFTGSRVYVQSGNNGVFIYFNDVNSNTQFSIGFNSTNGVITVYLGAQGSILGSSIPMTFLAGIWFYCEIGATIGGGTSGSITVKVNGIAVITLTGINSQGFISDTVMDNIVYVANSSTAALGIWFTHYYFCDSSGSAPWNTFLGDIRVQTLLPTSNDSVQFSSVQPTSVYTGPSSSGNGSPLTINTIRYYQITPTVGGIPSAIQVAGFQSYYSSGNIRSGIYDSTGAGGTPGTLLATSTALNNPEISFGVGGVWTFPITSGPTLIANTIYYIALQVDSSNCYMQSYTINANTVVTYPQSQAYSLGLPSTATVGTVGVDSSWFALVIPLTTNYAAISKVPPLPSLDYNTDITVGHQDTFNCSAIGSDLSTIYGLNVKALIGKSDAGSRTVAAVIKSGTTTLSGTATSIGVSPQLVKQMFQTDPNTSTQWTQTNADAAKPGYKIVS